MGCLSLHFLKACINPQSPKIKVMTAQGKCFKYVAPTIVKEVLMDHPLHALFASDEVRKQGVSRARPLQSNLFLQPGHLYFLISLPSRQNSMASSLITSSPSHEAAQKCSTQTRKVSFAEAPMEKLASTNSLNCVGSILESNMPLRGSSVQILPSPCDGVVRLKMVVSKRKLASVLKEGGDCVSIIEGLLSPLLQASRINGQTAIASSSDDLSTSRSWRPSLKSIPEFT